MRYAQQKRWQKLHLAEAVDVLKQIRHLDIRHKMEHGSFFLPQEIREKIHTILLGCELRNG